MRSDGGTVITQSAIRSHVRKGVVYIHKPDLVAYLRGEIYDLDDLPGKDGARYAEVVRAILKNVVKIR